LLFRSDVLLLTPSQLAPLYSSLNTTFHQPPDLALQLFTQ